MSEKPQLWLIVTKGLGWSLGCSNPSREMATVLGVLICRKGTFSLQKAVFPGKNL